MSVAQDFRARDHVLALDCPDRPGIVAAVAGALRDSDCNIEESAQFSDHLSGRFFMRTVVRPLVREADLDRFRAEFAAVAAAFAMRWRVTDTAEKVATLVMVSKADHCLNDILYRWRTGHLPIRITAVVSNHEAARSLVEGRGLSFIHLPVRPETRADQEGRLAAIVEETGSELIVLARYMQILTDGFCARYAGRIINIHHSFLPSFRGAKPYHQAYVRGVKIVGATAHFVTRDLDEGPIIEQETIRIDHAHTPEKLQILGQDIEARVLSRAILYYAERRIFLHENRTIIL